MQPGSGWSLAERPLTKWSTAKGQEFEMSLILSARTHGDLSCDAVLFKPKAWRPLKHDLLSCQFIRGTFRPDCSGGSKPSQNWGSTYEEAKATWGEQTSAWTRRQSDIPSSQLKIRPRWGHRTKRWICLVPSKIKGHSPAVRSRRLEMNTTVLGSMTGAVKTEEDDKSAREKLMRKETVQRCKALSLSPYSESVHPRSAASAAAAAARCKGADFLPSKRGREGWRDKEVMIRREVGGGGEGKRFSTCLWVTSRERQPMNQSHWFSR